MPERSHECRETRVWRLTTMGCDWHLFLAHADVTVVSKSQTAQPRSGGLRGSEATGRQRTGQNNNKELPARTLVAGWRVVARTCALFKRLHIELDVPYCRLYPRFVPVLRGASRGAHVFFLHRACGLPSFLCDLTGPLRRSHGMEGLVSYGKRCT